MKMGLPHKTVTPFIMTAVITCMSVLAVTMDNDNLIGVQTKANATIIADDYTKPTLIASVSNGVLSITGNDTGSGIKAFYVNEYEFDGVKDDTLNIRLQQFDAGYEYFTIQAEDNAGNMSDMYKAANPYFSDEEAGNTLPTSAEPTPPTSATATVTEHIGDDGNGEDEKGKEFYTIQMANEKVFYLIIDRDGENETVHFRAFH